MKKILPIIGILVVVGVVWMLSQNVSNTGTGVGGGTSPVSPTDAGRVPGAATVGNDQVASNMVNDIQANPNLNSPDMVIDEDEEGAIETKPAAQLYKSAQEAFEAVKNGAKDYDDVVLEQFTQPGDDCTWCPQFYQSVKEAIASPDISPDQRSYYAEILAISGRLDNIQGLVDNIKNAKSSEEADVFSEALELSVGNDEVTRYLGEQMSSTNESLKEASVAAVTNQGSRLAAELLVKNTVERGDPDGYYSVGIGLGEFIPDEEAIPVVQEVVSRRDQFSHLGVKALLNSGLNGLKLVFDELEASKNPEADRALIKDAIDHVNYEDGLETFVDQKINSGNPVAAEFAKQIKEEFANQAEADIGDLEE